MKNKEHWATLIKIQDKYYCLKDVLFGFIFSLGQIHCAWCTEESFSFIQKYQILSKTSKIKKYFEKMFNFIIFLT